MLYSGLTSYSSYYNKPTMICIVDYGVGNLMSIRNMLKKAGAEALISNRKEDIAQASALLLPGMGHFDHCMQQFNASGLRESVERMVFDKKTPVLGICVGLQMLMASSEEGKEPGLGWIPGETIRFKTDKMATPQRIPNMGWLEVKPGKTSRLLQDLVDPRFYFAHSYHVQNQQSEDTLLLADYGYTFTVGLEKDNILGVQFHPEKSHRFGMQLLKNFAENY